MMSEPHFWHAIHAGRADRAPVAAPHFDETALAAMRAALRKEGYFQREDVLRSEDLAETEAILDAVTRFGLPALFAFAYDAPWRLFLALGDLLRGVLGPGYRSLAAFWAWRLDPAREERGWPKHRDRTMPTLDASGDPEVVTVWLPITPATLDNGCIRVVPASRDADYFGDLNQRAADDDAVRPLPVDRGTVLGWTHQLLHWGGRATKDAPHARMSLSAEFQRATGDALDDVIDALPPTLEQRLALIGAQILRYQHMQTPSAKLLGLATALTRPRSR